MTDRHANISIFVPHIGCPNMCSFCNQRHITGKNLAPRTSDVIESVKTAVLKEGYNPLNTEIAFFGGSFTAINRNYMLDLLKTAHIFVENDVVSGIRISTRPDAINEEILQTLKKYGVTSIELGAQSLNDLVLFSNNRGHSAEDVFVASRMIKEHGFSLGLQMMTGLYNDCDDFSLDTARKIIEMKPDTVRIYPTIVLKDTDLAALHSDDKYIPQTLDEAVNLAVKLILMFEQADIKIIRLGLHSIEKDTYIAGPWHPAFSELCYSKIMLNKAIDILNDSGKYTLFVAPASLSKMIGQRKGNIEKLKTLGFDCSVKADDSLKGYEIRAERRN